MGLGGRPEVGARTNGRSDPELAISNPRISPMPNHPLIVVNRPLIVVKSGRTGLEEAP